MSVTAHIRIPWARYCRDETGTVYAYGPMGIWPCPLARELSHQWTESERMALPICTTKKWVGEGSPARTGPARMPTPASPSRVMPRSETYDFTYAGRSNVRVGIVEEKYDFTY